MEKNKLAKIANLVFQQIINLQYSFFHFYIIGFIVIKKILKFLFTVLFILLLVIILKTCTYSSRQISVAAVSPMEISDTVAEKLSGAVQIPTRSFSDRVDTMAFEELKLYLEKTYPIIYSKLEVNYINKFTPIIKWPGKNTDAKPILLIAHLDIVPVEGESLKAWSEDPYGGKIDEKFIWGRGTLDDKVSALGILEAAEILIEEKFIPEKTIYFAFGHDEEVGGRAGAVSASRYFKEKNIKFEYVLDEGSILLEKALPGIAPPVALIGIAEKGYTTLSLTAKLSEGGHSSMPPQETAIGILSAAIHQLETQPFPAKLDGAVREMFDHLGPEMALPNKAIFANTWLFKPLLMNQLGASGSSNAMIRTTTAPTILQAGVKENVLPSTAQARVNFRILPGETVASVRERVEQVIDDARVEVKVAKTDGFSSEPSSVSSTRSPAYQNLEKTIRQIFPEAITTPSLVIAATDARHYHAVAEDIYRFIPLRMTHADLKRIHGIDERIAIEDYKNCIRFYYQLLKNSGQ